MEQQLLGNFTNLMMGVLIASTSLCGLTSVVIGQIRVSHDLWIHERKAMVGSLSVSFLCGMAAIFLTIVWFPGATLDSSLFSEVNLAPWLLFVQIVFLTAPIVGFWFSNDKE